MLFKIDTREKFHAITLQEPVLYANMTEELVQLFAFSSQKDVKNIVLRCMEVKEIDLTAAETILSEQQKAYEKGYSFVISELRPQVEDFLDKHGILEQMNVVPTESEAWDIVQMEEIERDLFADGDEGS